jgi:dihydropteroate synthase
MGIVNATPDSFYDGGLHRDLVAHGRRLVDQGADWIDVGGESTRPGSMPVGEQEECDRVLPVIEALAKRTVVSIDTTKPGVARQALGAGARIINDVKGLCDPEMVALTEQAWGTVVMHSRGTPATMNGMVEYGDLVEEVAVSLVESARRARSPHVWIDPGIGFAKTATQSVLLLRHIRQLVDTGFPVLVGASRKSFIGHTLGIGSPDDRLAGSLAAAAAAYHGGASVVRVHDVAHTCQFLDMLEAIVQRPEASILRPPLT